MKLFEELTQDEEFKFLVSEGLSGSLNDMAHSYLISQGYSGTIDDMLKQSRGGLLGTFSTLEGPQVPTSIDLVSYDGSSGVVVDLGNGSITYETSSWSRYPVSLSGEVWTTMEKSGVLPGSTKIGGLTSTLNPTYNLLGRDKGADSWKFNDFSGSTHLRGLVGAMGVGETVQIDAIKYKEMGDIKSKPVDIVVLMGQSLGLGTDSVMDGDLDGWTDANMSAVHLTSDDTIVAGEEFPLTAPLNHQNGGRSGVCPAVHMGKTIEGYTEAGRRVLFLAANWGGSSLVTGEAHWDPSTGLAYSAMKTTLDSILSSLPSGSRVKCMVWDHGQSEYASLASGAYQSAVNSLVSTFRGEYGNVPVFVSGNIPAATATLASNLISAQESFATGSGSAYEMSDCIFVARTEGMVTIDGTHPDAASQRTHGVNLGLAWRSRFIV